MTDPTTAAPLGARDVLRIPAYRNLWLAQLVSEYRASPPDKPKKQAGAGNQTPTSLKCLLFRKCP